VVELAVVPACPVGLLQAQNRNVMVGSKGLDLAAEPVADLLEQGRRGDREPKVLGEEGGHLAAHLQVRHVGVQIEPINAVERQADVAVEDVVDVGHGRHHTSVPARGTALPARQPRPASSGAGRRPGGGPVPLPLTTSP
jgi:hypothetical protein